MSANVGHRRDGRFALGLVIVVVGCLVIAVSPLGYLLVGSGTTMSFMAFAEDLKDFAKLEEGG